MKAQETNSSAKITPYSTYLEEFGVAAVTGWRWRRKGWIKTVNIAGRQYITAEAKADFERRAIAGEFAKLPNLPTPVSQLADREASDTTRKLLTEVCPSPSNGESEQ